MLRFGTDGVRGLANEELGPEVALALGRAAPGVLRPVAAGAPGPDKGDKCDDPSPSRPCFVVGRDTRRSGPLLQAALASGLAAEGADVVDVGVMPTPAVAYVAAERGVPAAVVSASHNPYWDNGVKFFSAGGTKLSDEVEKALESEFEAFLAGTGHRGTPLPTRDAVGAITSDPGALSRYESFVLRGLCGRTLGGLRVALDCANGAAWQSGPEIFEAAGARVVAVLGAQPNGTNINDHCGSTDPRALAGAVVSHGADIGLAFDGDADRVIAVDALGNVVDGDRLLALFATDLEERGLLSGRTVVVTVMTNLGFHKAMAGAGVRVHTVSVGDRYILQALEANGWALGGEQSGHIVFRELATTGDGVMSGLLLADLLVRRGEALAPLAAASMKHFPQILRNVAVADRHGLPEASAVWEEVRRTEQVLGQGGRVLLRPSGTEPLVRVMVEAPTEEEASAAVERLVETIHIALGGPAG